LEVLTYAGCAKVLVVIRPEHTIKFERSISIVGTSCSNNVAHKRFVPSFDFLASHNIDFSIVIQHPGDALAITEGAYFYSFNLGPSCYETIRAATAVWKFCTDYRFCTTSCGNDTYGSYGVLTRHDLTTVPRKGGYN
jgi:hypothetical protein